MKKLIFLFFLTFCVFNIASCTPSEVPDPVDPSENMVTVRFDTAGGSLINPFTLNKGEKIPENVIPTPTKADASFVGWSLTGESDDIFIFKDNIINENIILIAIWDNHFKDYSYLIDEYVPSVITGNLYLPQNVDNLKLIWSSTDPITLNYEGIVNPDIADINLDVLLEVYDDGYSTFYKKPVVVKAHEFKDLTTNVTFGYYSGWNYLGLPEEINTSVDVINICFAYVNNDFSLNFSDLTPYIKSIMNAHNYGIRVVLSVQGYSSGGTNFSRAASTKEGRKTLANNMLNLVKKYHMDGIDIDWEYPGYGTNVPTDVDRANYTLLIKELYDTFKTENSKYLITAAIPGGPYLPSRFDLKEVSKYLDYIHMMTYDMQAGGKATHHSALHPSPGTASGCSVSESVEYFINHGVPREKCVIGIAFYGRRCHAIGITDTCYGYQAVTYTKIYNEYLSRIGNGVTVYFDNVSQASYLLDTDHTVFITYDDELSIQAKCNYAKTKGLGGVMIWELGEDETLTLIQAVKKGMN